MKVFAYSLIASLVVLGSCASRDSKGPAEKSLFAREVKQNPYWDELARYLAGMPPVPGGELAALSNSPSFRAHAATMNRFWHSVEQRTLRSIGHWRERALPEESRRTLLYPLSGADLLNAHSFFPDARRYVMIALEPPGAAGDPRDLSEQQRARGLHAVRVVIASMATRNYLYSATMRAYKGGEYPFSGTLPALLIFAARLGLEVVDVQNVGLDSGGRLHVMGAGDTAPVRGLRICVRDGGALKDIVYLNIALSNRNVNANTAAGAYLSGLGEFNVMMKAAIYLLHRDGYGGVRDFLLENSQIIVQDDSGIPYRDFDREEWSLDLYGNYVDAPRMRDAGYWPQPELAQAYRWHRKPLYFSYGYGMLTRGRASNIQVAVKKR